MKYKSNNKSVPKLQTAWTTMPTVKDAFNRAFDRQNAIRDAEQKAKEQVASEKPKYTFVNPYDITRGWREATEDAAKQDKYTVQNLGGSEEEAQKAYDNTWKNSRKQLAATTAQGILMAPMLGDFSTYGLLGGGLRIGTGWIGSKAGEYVLGKGGDWADKKLNTNFLGTTGRIIGGLGGWWGGANATMPLFRNLAGKGITLHMPQETFMNLRGQYFDNIARNIKPDTSVLWKLYNRDRQIKDYMEFGTSPSLKENVVKLVHWDPMGTGVKKATPINGGFKRGPEYFAHFENGNLVPAKGQIKSKLGNGQLYVHEQHPLFFGGNKPWWETPGSELSDEYLRLTTFNKSKFEGPHQYYDRWAKREKQNLKNLRNWYTKYGQQNANDRFLIVEPNDLKGYDFNSRLGIMGYEIPMSKLEGFEYDPLLGTFKRVKYVGQPTSNVSQPQLVKIPNTPFYRDVIPGSRPITEAERLGIPKALRSNPKVLEDPYYWGYQQWNSRYNAAIESGDMVEAQRLRDLHFKIKAPDTKIIDEGGMPKEIYHFTNAPSFHKFNLIYKRDDQYPIYFTSDINGRSIYYPLDAYQKSKLKVYLKMNRPLKEDLNKTKRAYDYYDLDKTMKTDPIDREEIRKFWRKKYDDLFDLSIDKDLRGSNPKKAHQLFRKASDIWFNNIHNRYGKEFPMKQSEIFDLSRNKNFESLLKQEFQSDGVIHNVDGTTHYITYNPEFIKFSKIMTYDDNGNLIPIVKRDNFHNLDIRYKRGGILKAQPGTIIKN